MFEVKIDSQKNRMCVILKGYLTETEAQHGTAEVIKAIEVILR